MLRRGREWPNRKNNNVGADLVRGSGICLLNPSQVC